MIDGVRVKDLKLIPDERGYVLEMLRVDDWIFRQFGQAYVSATWPGAVKAWHCHRKQIDSFVCLVGMVKLVLYDSRPDSPTRSELNEFFIGEQHRQLVQIPIGVQHGWKCVSDQMALVVNLCSEPYDYEHPDEERIPAHGVLPYNWDRQDR